MLFVNTMCSATQVLTFYCPGEEALCTQGRKNMAWRIRSTELSCSNSPFQVGGIRGEISHKSYEGGQTMGPNNKSDNIKRIKFKDPHNLF